MAHSDSVTTSQSYNAQVCLIGAGPAGLAGARNLQRFGIDFEGFEAGPSVGGLWDIDNPRSTVYESAHLISSKRMTEFKEFPMRDEVAEYPHHSELKRYFNDYADHFGLRDYFRFNTMVKACQRDEHGWQVTLADGEVRRYRALICANGNLSEPKQPEFGGQFAGEILHSADYKSADVFANKRVLIVGAGNSGCDIAVDAAHRATLVDLSVRRGYHFVPKYVFGKPADSLGGAIKLPLALRRKIDKVLLGWFTGDPQRYGFPEPDHELYQVHPIVNSLVLYYLGHGDIKVRANIERFEGHTVHFTGGRQQDYDLIMYCTGYKLHYPFLPADALTWDGPAPALYLNTFQPNADDLFVLGMVEASGIGWQGRWQQGELVAAYLKGVLDGQDAATAPMRQRIAQGRTDLSGGFNYKKIDRMAYYVHKDSFLQEMAACRQLLGAIQPTATVGVAS